MFGWDYPPGAEHDPNAPWNQPEPDEEPEIAYPDDGDVAYDQRKDDESDVN